MENLKSNIYGSLINLKSYKDDYIGCCSSLYFGNCSLQTVSKQQKLYLLKSRTLNLKKQNIFSDIYQLWTNMFECKVLVTGGSGLLGRQIMSVLSGAGVSCHGLCFSRPGEQLTSLDLTDFPASKKFIVDYKPSHVIHTAAQVREVYNKCYNMIKAFLVGISVSIINYLKTFELRS